MYIFSRKTGKNKVMPVYGWYIHKWVHWFYLHENPALDGNDKNVKFPENKSVDGQNQYGCKDPLKGRMYLGIQNDRHFSNTTCTDNHLLCVTLQLFFLPPKSMGLIFPEILPQIDLVWYCWFYNLVMSEPFSRASEMT